MKTNISLLSILVLSSTLFWGVPFVGANELVETEVVEFAGYCHMKFPPMSESTLFSERPELSGDAEKIIDFYGPCGYDPTGADEIRAQRRILLRGLHDDGSED